ncbi:hypothetical protein L596_021324 [Steinernema carpocapsae]|nr:hypothetical protein L596_021324 [Steinernema carpocapsae]
MVAFGWLLVAAGFVIAGARDYGHPIPSRDIEYVLRCPKCYTEKRGQDRRYRCVREPDCCLPLEPKRNCIVNPCLFFQKSCKEAVYCIAVPCGPDYCTNELYDANFDLIDFNYCNKTSNRAKQRVMLNKSKRVVLVRRSQSQSEIIRNMKVFNPARYHVKPGTCSYKREIIKVCINECSNDSNCPGRQKCCFNGCARRCVAPILQSHNYMNVPIYVSRGH